MKINAKDGEWTLGYRWARKGKEKFPYDLPSLAEFLGLFPEELLSLIQEKEELHLESVNLGQFLIGEASSI